MKNKTLFQTMVEHAMQIPGRSHMRPVIEKELLHYDILFALDQENMLDQLTFQGGTALRLCYGGQRFSEDLDFTGGKYFSQDQLSEMKNCLEKYLGQRYGLMIEVKTPREIEKKIEDIRVDVWQLAVTTSPEKKDIPKQKIKIEVINIPSYSKEPKAVVQNYNFLPSGYQDLLVMTESLEEIMADKLVSLVNCTRYVRYRDIWDLRWLKQRGAAINLDFVMKKIQDYRIEEYRTKLENCIQNLDAFVYGKEFYQEMQRFIPIDVLEKTLQSEKFLRFLYNEVKELLMSLGVSSPHRNT